MTATGAEASSLVGQVLDDRYEIMERLGEGGVGLVYRARRLQLDRVVAIKVLHEALVEDSGFVGRFQREAVAMSRLYHPHCVAVTDFGTFNDRPYLVLEYVPGETVKDLLKDGPFKPERAVHIALQLLETLEYFHSHHVVHRDLKSENVMLVESSGTKDFVKVLDFGMAKILTGPGADSQLSVIGFVPGTPSIMAPEQIQQLPPDPRIDIYAMGIMLYEMVVGQRPFRGDDMATVVKMQMSETPKAPREVLGAQALSAQLEEVILRALEKDRLDRYATVGEMAKALRATPEARGFDAQRTKTPVPVAGPANDGASAASKGRLWPIAVLGLLVLAAAGVLLWPEPPPPPPPPVVAAPPAPKPNPADPPPPPEPVVDPWLAHRDLAATYSTRGQHDDAYREVQAAVADSPEAAAADNALVDTAAKALTKDRVDYVTETFGGNPRLPERLAALVTQPEDPDLRHAALAGLRALDKEAEADLVGMQILDLRETDACGRMRSLYNQLRRSDDPRVDELRTELKQRDKKDPHARCLRKLLRRR